MKKNLKKVYKRYKTSDVILISALQFPKEQAIQIANLFPKKITLYLPCEVDDFKKAFNSLDLKTAKQIVHALR